MFTHEQNIGEKWKGLFQTRKGIHTNILDISFLL